MKQTKITACLVIHNEEKVIERCLKSIVNVVDEIIVVHDGPCSDSSLEICKKYSAKIYVRKHVGEAEYHRPFAFKQAKGDWILHIDADEYLSKEAQREIPKLVKSSTTDAYLFKWPIWIHSKNRYIKKGPYSKMLRMCLYRKSKMYMLGLTHFHPGTLGNACIKSNILLNHKPNKPIDFSIEYTRKILTWSKIAAGQVGDYLELPYFGPQRYKQKINSSIKNELNFSIIYTFTKPLSRLAWFIKNGGLFSGVDSYKTLLVDLSYLFFRYYYITVIKIK